MALRLMPRFPRRRIRFVTVASGLKAFRNPVGLATLPPTSHQQRMPGPRGFAVRNNIVRLRVVRRSRETRPAIPLHASAAASTAARPNVRDDGQRPSERDGMAMDLK